MDAAINQHLTVSTFVKQHVPNQHVPCTITPDSYDDNHAHDVGDIDMTSMTAVPTIQIQIEDFGGSFNMPHYGHSWPSVDYFNSNLMVSNFVIVDLTNDNADVLFYDEQAQGKDVDALCSL